MFTMFINANQSIITCAVGVMFSCLLPRKNLLDFGLDPE